MTVVLMRGFRITPTTESEVTRMPDCVTPLRRTTVGDIRGGSDMTRWIAVLLVAATGFIAGSSRAYAQEVSSGPGRVEVSIIPAGGVFFTERTETGAPRSCNYDLRGAVAGNSNPYVG